MPAETWDMDCVVEESAESFPEFGDANTMYVVQVIVSGSPQRSFFYWDGSGYSSFSVGPRPHPHPHG